MKLGYSLALLLSLGVSGSLRGQSPSIENSGWRTYRNTNYNFLLRYPSGAWSKNEGVDRNGVRLAARDKRQFHLRPEIEAGGAVGQPSDSDETRNRNIEEDFQVGLDGLKRYSDARNLSVLSKLTTRIHGLPAIVSTIRYEDSSNGQIWFNKEILIHGGGDSPTYQLTLRCSSDDVSVLVPLFDRICKTFRILGPPA
jgi:hypothetical protein